MSVLSPAHPIQKNNVTISGNPNAGRSIIFTQGFGTDQHAWDAVASALAADYRLIRYDLTGTGRSDPAAFVQHRYLNLRAYAADLVDICEALRLRDAVAVGHSVGGMISVLAAIRRPEHFSKLVLIGASPRYVDDSTYRGGFSKADVDGIYSAITRDMPRCAGALGDVVPDHSKALRLAQDLAADLRSLPSTTALTIACTIFQSDHRADLARLDKPTLVVQSRNDGTVPTEVARYLNEHIRGSRLKVIEATGHSPHVTAPQEVVAALREFL